ncbi:MAG: quinoprotein dehydrogenase-associated SoxYZ-like carrier, partial [Pseudomonadota bacterium]
IVKDVTNPMTHSETWEILREDITDHTEFLNGDELITFQAPDTAFDAGMVPISIRQKRNSGERITNMTIVIDENPAPLVANFEMGPLMGELYLESRVRYDSPSNIRVIAETDQNNVYMAGRFVQAAGGCAGAASGDLLAAMETMGQMKLRMFEGPGGSTKASGTVKQAQLMIRHPNFTGMQALPETKELIDARYIDFVEVYQGDEMLFRMTGGFSISQDPTFRFSYVDNGAAQITVKATDTSGAVFQKTFGQASGA